MLRKDCFGFRLGFLWALILQNVHIPKHGSINKFSELCLVPRSLDIIIEHVDLLPTMRRAIHSAQQIFVPIKVSFGSS